MEKSDHWKSHILWCQWRCAVLGYRCPDRTWLQRGKAKLLQHGYCTYFMDFAPIALLAQPNLPPGHVHQLHQCRANGLE